MCTRFDLFALVVGCSGAIASFSPVAFAAGPADELAKPRAVEREHPARGDIAAGFSATGTIEPQEVADASAQVDGRIVSFGNDSKGRPIDYNSKVEKGDVLAKIDDAVYVSRLDEAEPGCRSLKQNKHSPRPSCGKPPPISSGHKSC